LIFVVVVVAVADGVKSNELIGYYLETASIFNLLFPFGSSIKLLFL